MIRQISNETELKLAIMQLRAKEAEEKIQLEEQLDAMVENLRPANILRNAFSKIKEKGLGINLADAAIGTGVGLLSKKLVAGNSHNLLKKLLGTLVQVGMTNLVAKNTDTIGDGIKYIRGLFKKKPKEEVL